MKNNKGLSYIELIVVIAVMVLLTGFSVLSISLATRTNATKAGDKMVTMLTTARTYSLAKGKENGAFHIRKIGNGYECAVGNLADSPKFEEFATSPVTITYFDLAGNQTPIDISSGIVSFKFSQTDGSLVENTIGTDSPGGFIISKGEDPVARVILYELTGKCELVLE